MPAEPEWRRLESDREAKLRKEAEELAIFMLGPGWSDKHDKAAQAYLKRNA